MLKRVALTSSVVFALVATPASAESFRDKYEKMPAAGTEYTCFVPKQDCTQFVADFVALANKQILVMAYEYTDERIREPIGAAKRVKKLDVRVVLDKTNASNGAAKVAAKDGIPVWIDFSVSGIHHNKVIIIDGAHVLTGSFNFSKAAQKKNAENIRVNLDNPKLAARYVDYWNERQIASTPYDPDHPPPIKKKKRSRSKTSQAVPAEKPKGWLERLHLQ